MRGKNQVPPPSGVSRVFREAERRVANHSAEREVERIEPVGAVEGDAGDAGVNVQREVGGAHSNTTARRAFRFAAVTAPRISDSGATSLKRTATWF